MYNLSIQLHILEDVLFYIFCGLESVGYSFELLKDVWIRTRELSVKIKRATNLAIQI